MRKSRDAPLYDVPMWTKFDSAGRGSGAASSATAAIGIIHGHTVRTALIGSVAAAMTGVPMVYHAHSPASHDTTRRWTNRLNGLVERLSLRRVSRVIAVSQAMAEHIAGEGFDPARITVVPNGVPVAGRLCPTAHAPADRWTLGVVALFRPRKGIEVLLDAMAILRRQGLPVHLRAVGTFESPDYASRNRRPRPATAT